MWAHLAAWDAQLAGDLVPVCWRQILLVNESLLKLKDLGVGEGGSGFPLLLCITFFPQLDLVWRWNELLICLVNLCSGWWGDHWFGVQSRHPPTLITGRCHWSQVSICQSEDRVVTWLTNKILSLLRNYHYPGLVIVRVTSGSYCQVKWSRNWSRCQDQGLLWFLWFLVSSAQWMTSERGGRLSNCVVISVMKIDRTLIELANHHQQPGWAQQKHRNTIQHHTSLGVLLRLKIELSFFRIS